MASPVLLPWPLTFTKIRWWSFFLTLVKVNGRSQEKILKCVLVMDAFLKRLIIYLPNYNNKQEVESFRKRQRQWERPQRRTQMSWKRNQFVSGSGSGGIQGALLPPTMTTIIPSKGLSNEPGQNSCFLNSALQVHTRRHTHDTHTDPTANHNNIQIQQQNWNCWNETKWFSWVRGQEVKV